MAVGREIAKISDIAPRVSAICEVPVSEVVGYLQAEKNTISKLGENAAALVLANVANVSRTYFSKDIDNKTATVIAREIIKQFPGIAPEEISEAYSRWSVGKLKTADELPFVFSARHTGLVLAAYNEERTRVVSRAKMVYNDQMDALADAQREARMKEAFERTFPETLEKMKNKVSSFEEIPVYFYQACKELGMITLSDDEKLEFAKQAREIEEKKVDVDEHQKRMNRLRGIMHKETPISTRIANTALRLAVWQKVFNVNI